MSLFEQGPLVVVRRRPRFEGCNVGTWIGFKHILYLIEESALEFLRARGFPPGRLHAEHGVGVEIVSIDARLLEGVDIDDLVRLEVRSLTVPGERELELGVTAFVERGGREVKADSARVKLALRRHRGATVSQPEALLPFVVDEIRRGEPTPPAGGLRWRFRIPYFYCHYSERLQHSGYARLLEESVDRYLADRGISIWSLLESRAWIPVVANARVEVHREARMEEELHIAFAVEETFKDVTWTANMCCSVVRDGKPLVTATGRITHAYLHIRDRGRGGAVVTWDTEVVAALRGGR